jgi:hypothetical protein
MKREKGKGERGKGKAGFWAFTFDLSSFLWRSPLTFPLSPYQGRVMEGVGR